MSKQSESSNAPQHPLMKRLAYDAALETLQIELVKLQEWVKYTGAKICVIFEGRDTAGKGGVIRTITERVSPRVFRVVALPAPTEREKTQMYMQRYLPHFPAAGEIVIFDRSWYNRAGVEVVMGFCSKEQNRRFLELCPVFEEYVTSNRIILIKFWLEVSNEEQERRFKARISDPLRQWKLSPMDLQSRVRWEDYTKAKEEMFARTNIPEAPWFIVEGNDKKRARLNCVDHLLQHIPYTPVPHQEINLPHRVFDPNYERKTLPARLYVPQKY